MTILELTLISADEELQPRCKTDRNVSHEYGLAMARGAAFPSIDVFWDGETYWLADGFHRFDAARALGLARIDCRIHEGSRQDALWFTCSANATNGLHRTREDVRFSIRRALLLRQSVGWSDIRISDHVGCSPKTVAAVRAELVAAGDLVESKIRIGKDGRTRDVSDIGASTPEIPELAENDEPEPEPDEDEPEQEPEPEPSFVEEIEDNEPEDVPSTSAQTDIEDVPGVKPAAKVVPMIDPKWEHLPANIGTIVRAHANLPAPGIAAANFPECLGHTLDIRDVEAVIRWWQGLLPLWRARQPELERYLARITANR
jgi:hypothetical protein